MFSGRVYAAPHLLEKIGVGEDCADAEGVPEELES